MPIFVEGGSTTRVLQFQPGEVSVGFVQAANGLSTGFRAASPDLYWRATPWMGDEVFKQGQPWPVTPFSNDGGTSVTPGAADEWRAFQNFSPAIEATPEVVPEFGWFEQAGKPAIGRRRSPDDSFVRVAINFTVATPTDLGWFEPYALPARAVKKALDNSFAQAPVNITAPPFGWFEPYTRQPPAGKGPASTVAMDPQEIAAPPTLTTSIGWFEPYAKRPPETKGPGSSTAWDPQPIAAAPTLTTSIGWFEPFGRPLATPKARLDSWSSFFGSRPDLGLAWFEPYVPAPRPKAKVPQSWQSVVVVPAAAVPSFGWYFHFGIPPRKPRAILTGWAIEIPAPPAPAPVVLPDCGHLTSSVTVGADLIPGLTVPGAMVESISTAGKATASFSRTATARVTVSKGGSLRSTITCR